VGRSAARSDLLRHELLIGLESGALPLHRLLLRPESLLLPHHQLLLRTEMLVPLYQLLRLQVDLLFLAQNLQLVPIQNSRRTGFRICVRNNLHMVPTQPLLLCRQLPLLRFGLSVLSGGAPLHAFRLNSPSAL
jgi:hypothetical protein